MIRWPRAWPAGYDERRDGQPVGGVGRWERKRVERRAVLALPLCRWCAARYPPSDPPPSGLAAQCDQDGTARTRRPESDVGLLDEASYFIRSAIQRPLALAGSTQPLTAGFISLRSRAHRPCSSHVRRNCEHDARAVLPGGSWGAPAKLDSAAGLDLARRLMETDGQRAEGRACFGTFGPCPCGWNFPVDRCLLLSGPFPRHLQPYS